MAWVYLIHFDRPIGNAANRRAQAQHYIGYTSRPLAKRILDHALGRGAAIMRYLKDQRVGWSVVRTWKGGRDLERKLKDRKSAKSLCTMCACKEQIP